MGVYFFKMLNRQLCAPTVFVYADIVVLKVRKTMDVVLHKQYVARSVDFEHFVTHFERVVADAVVFWHHQSARRQAL